MNNYSQNGDEPDNWLDFLKRLLNGRFPPYGILIWDGETQQVSITVHLELNKQESAETVRQRAYRFFSQLTPEERLTQEIEVTLRDGKPVRAIMKPRAGVIKIGTGRLRRLIDLTRY